MQRYNLTLMGMCKVRWTGHGETKLQTEETLLYSDKNEERHEAGVEILLSKKAANSLLEWNPVSDCIIRARFKKVSIIMCYAPTNTSEEEDKNSFYAQLQSVLDKISNRDMLILMGDMNAKVGADNTDREREMGRHGLGEMNENGEMLADFCSTNSLVIGGTIFSHRKYHKDTWVSPDKLTKNQIDHIMVKQRYKSSLQDVRVRRGATTRILSGRHCNPNRPVRNKEGRLLTIVEDQPARWKEHFQEVLNRPALEQRPQLNPSDPLDINIGEITEKEIYKALSSLKNGKAAGTDNLPAEALKEGGTGIINQLHQLLNLIWATEKIPTEWSKGLLVKLPKYGELSQCGKWRGITLLSIPSKVLSKIILERMKDTIDNVLRDEQAGFRKERSCDDQIATLRIIVEQSIEWQSLLYTCFIDFEKAFDSVNRESIWNILLHYGVPIKFVDIIKALHEGFSCQVIHAGKLSESFEISSGVRQGCLLSPLLFLVVLDWVTKKAYGSSGKGIQ